jgi:hypothetical protein
MVIRPHLVIVEQVFIVLQLMELGVGEDGAPGREAGVGATTHHGQECSRTEGSRSGNQDISYRQMSHISLTDLALRVLFL